MNIQETKATFSPEITRTPRAGITRDVSARTESANLRVLMVTARYFPYMGGVESHVYQVCRWLAQQGVDVTVLTTDPSGQLPSSDQVNGVKIRRVWAWPANRDYYFAPDIYHFIRQASYDILHVQCYHTLVPPLAMLAALQSHIPYVVTFHGGGHSSHLRHTLRRVQWLLLRPLLARAERLVAVARFEIELFGNVLHIPRERFVLIPNGCDLPQVSHPNSPEAGGDTLIASVGRLERYKGHQHIIAAMPYILAHRPDVRLWIAGVGPYEAELQRLAKKLGVADRVLIRAIPATDRETMAIELSKAALFVLLSEYETHPIAALEALALGRPALVADTSGLSELAERGLARAIPLVSTPQQVAAAVFEQLNHPLVPPHLDLPTWDDCAAGLLNLYQAIVQRQLCAS